MSTGDNTHQMPRARAARVRSDRIWFSSELFEKLSPGPKNGPERRLLRFSTICTKNQVLKLNIDKVMLILAAGK